MKKYMGFKLIEATPMSYQDFKGMEATTELKPGYKVRYMPDGYESWSPKDVFEKAYMQIGDNNSVTQGLVDSFIKEVHVSTVGEKTTLVRAVLVNGFEIIESSACVDKANYNEELGANVCLTKIKDKIWGLLGFLLQTAKDGIK